MFVCFYISLTNNYILLDVYVCVFRDVVSRFFTYDFVHTILAVIIKFDWVSNGGFPLISIVCSKLHAKILPKKTHTTGKTFKF